MLDLTFTAPQPKVISGAKADWELVIGLEVHAQVASNAKLFSGASTSFGAEPNANVAFVDAAMPGMLPVVNEFCVAQAVRTGLGLKAQINLRSAFDRKNYFYPDLPQGYQISQLYHPIVGEGEVIVDMGPGIARRVRIERIHLEQDAGKSIHDMDPNMSFVDLNRTGVALMEIVSRPDIRGPEEAAAYVAKLRQILRYLGTCDGNMQNGNLRADVNVSVCKPGQYEKYQATQDFSHLGTRCEIKNMNSLRFIQAAIDYEARRQIAILEDGGSIVQETRLYDPDKGETRSMRSKEEAHDYRYFPDPDLLPLEIEQAWVDDIAATMPELPDARKARYMGDFGLTDYDASVLTAEKENAVFFEAVATGRDGKTAANWVINESVRPAEQGGPRHRRKPGLRGPAWRRAGPDRLGRDLRQDGQGPVRDPVDRGRRACRDRRRPRHEAGDRYRRHRGRGGRDHRRQPRPGGKGPRQCQAGRLVHRPGAEGHRRQGQPGRGERDGRPQAGAVTLAPAGPGPGRPKGARTAGCGTLPHANINIR
ncbi:Glutamyl-tRNA(Gln) amidotransferase subunit B, chloroplastic/mitochondrial [Frigidibacter albus]